MKRILYVISLSLFLTSCIGCHDPRPRFYAPVLFLSNSQGVDLLNPLSPGHFYKDSIVLYWTRPNERRGVAINNPVPSNFPSYWPRGRYSIDLQPLRWDTLIIQLTRLDYDTLYFLPSYNDAQKIFYNKTLLTPPGGMTHYPANTTFPLVVEK